MSDKSIAILGALLAGAGVALGAYGAHGLEGQLRRLGHESNLAQRLAWFDTAVRYQLYHALALVVLAALPEHLAAGRRATGWLLVAGVALFCGSLFAMTFLGDAWKRLGAVTPLGGLAFIAGWAALAIGIWRR